MARAAAEKGLPPPRLVRDEVELWELCYPYWNGYVMLHRSRVFSAGPTVVVPQALAYSEISAYAQDHGFVGIADLDEFVYLVGVLDEAYLKDYAQQAAAKIKKTSTAFE